MMQSRGNTARGRTGGEKKKKKEKREIDRGNDAHA